MKRQTSLEKGAHRLTMEEVLENKNRSTIIDHILEEPGIHFNELLRKTDLAPGNLVWHLDILESYKVIAKKRVGNYVMYIPYYSKNPLSNIDLKLKKSELTLEILETIEKNPGIWNGKITDKMEIHRKTIQYHIDKLIDLGLVYKIKDGSKKKIFPNLDADYFGDSEDKKEEN
ncbi:MAG: winged helix-turn-helix transcriptional regulator [Candidatus Lokiarchaeota archaeon]|nr:winged helix-turn-helix transcriptional regulator [Candidatus Lokiarchaeota archaeon]MBD3201089.1 winged helix-turn-helix transcriptional regulator [Candidatus Lokiarchaeota archaeon]